MAKAFGVSFSTYLRLSRFSAYVENDRFVHSCDAKDVDQALHALPSFLRNAARNEP